MGEISPIISSGCSPLNEYLLHNGPNTGGGDWCHMLTSNDYSSETHQNACRSPTASRLTRSIRLFSLIYHRGIEQRPTKQFTFSKMVLGLLVAAGAVGLAGYGVGKSRERRDVANGYITYQDNGYNQPQYGNLHYGPSAQHYGGRYQGHQYSSYSGASGFY